MTNVGPTQSWTYTVHAQSIIDDTVAFEVVVGELELAVLLCSIIENSDPPDGRWRVAWWSNGPGRFAGTHVDRIARANGIEL